MSGQDRENDDYAQFAHRVIAAFASRVGDDGDVDALPALVALRDHLDAATAATVAALRSAPHLYSWQEIADRLGVTRQAAMQRWPQPDKTAARQPGGQPAGIR